MLISLAVAAVVGYVVGSVPIGLLLGYVFGRVDVRTLGTGNPGASNIRHNLGLVPGGVAAILTFVQGLGPPAVALALSHEGWVAVIAGIAAVVGNGWPVWLGFRGGRGVGVGTGASATLWLPGFVLLLAMFAAGWRLDKLALASFVGFCASAVLGMLVGNAQVKAFVLLLLAIIIARRLEGLSNDVASGPVRSLFLDRLFFDRRPGRALTGSAAAKKDG